MGKPRFFYSDSQGQDTVTLKYESPEANITIFNTGYFNEDYGEHNSLIVRTPDSVLVRKNADEQTWVSFGSGENAEDKQITSQEPKAKCNEIQSFFKSKGVSDPGLLSLVCQSTPDEIQNALIDDGHTVVRKGRNKTFP